MKFVFMRYSVHYWFHVLHKPRRAVIQSCGKSDNIYRQHSMHKNIVNGFEVFTAVKIQVEVS